VSRRIDAAAETAARSPAALIGAPPSNEDPMDRKERGMQAMLLLSRWLLAPFLVGLAIGMALLIYRFFADLYDIAVRLPGLGWHELVVDVLNLLDVALTANLILIVIFSSFENFVSKLDSRVASSWPQGLAAIDFGALKQKVLGSIVIIAAVDALAWYLDLEKSGDPAKLAWAIGFPLMFASLLLMLAIADRLGRHSGQNSDG
jgi:uncharacterized protein (TIGR00645 family)